MLQPEEDDTSDSSDEDYVPQEVEVSEEEESGDDEAIESEQTADGVKDKKKKTKKKQSKKNAGEKRKRAGGIKLDGDEDVEDEVEEKRDLTKEMEEERREKREQEEKKRVDDLFADFMKDVGPPAKSATTSSTSTKPQNAEAKPHAASYGSARKPEKVTVTKVFDFAGEMVKVTKEVEAGSKEAKAQADPEKEPSVAAATQKPTTTAPITGVKRPGGLGSVLGMIGKKQKMSALDKSKLDWESYKKDEGIEEELKTHNRGKDGFIERKNFLERSDLRQFEIEKNIRLANSKR